MTDSQMTTDQFLEALCLYREFRGEPDAAKVAGLCVIRNRTKDPKGRWPRTSSAVITQPYQFSSFNRSDPNCTVFPRTDTPGGLQAWQACVDVVLTPMDSDITHGATMYEALQASAPRPAWADPNKLTVQIGKTRFYRS